MRKSSSRSLAADQSQQLVLLGRRQTELNGLLVVALGQPDLTPVVVEDAVAAVAIGMQEVTELTARVGQYKVILNCIFQFRHHRGLSAASARCH